MFHLKPSKVFLYILLIVGGFGITNIGFASMTYGWHIVLLLGFCFAWYSVFSLDCRLLKPQSVIALQPLSSGQWQLHFQHQKCLIANLEGDSVVTAYVCILRFRTIQAKRFVCLVFKDSLSAKDYHRLLLITKMDYV